MLSALLSASHPLTVMAVGGLVFMLWCGAVLGWMIRRDSKSRRLRQRIGLYDSREQSSQTRVLRLWRESGEEAATTIVPHESSLATRLTRICRLPEDAGLDMSVLVMFTCIGVLLLCVMVVTWVLTGTLLAAAGVAALVVGAVIFVIQGRIARRRGVFEHQFEDAMNLIARSLRSGQPLLGAFQLVSEEMDAPISTVFNEVCQQQALGLSLEEAIQRVAAVHQNQDLNLFATSVVIQLRTGGNLADMMQRLAQIVRERLKLARRVRVLTAQTQYSKRVLLVLPLFMLVLLTAMNPGYMEPMYSTETGQYLSVAAGVSMALGAWMMNRMSRLQH